MFVAMVRCIRGNAVTFKLNWRQKIAIHKFSREKPLAEYQLDVPANVIGHTTILSLVDLGLLRRVDGPTSRVSARYVLTEAGEEVRKSMLPLSRLVATNHSIKRALSKGAVRSVAMMAALPCLFEA